MPPSSTGSAPTPRAATVRSASSLPTNSVAERVIARRWLELAPWILIHVRSQALKQHLPQASVPAMAESMRDRHREAMLQLLAAKVDMRRVRALQLDDVRLPELLRMKLVKNYLERRARRKPRKDKPLAN